jgi:hypothetical protein
MNDTTKKAIRLIESYLLEINNASEKFTNEFHLLDRENEYNDESIEEALKELGDCVARYTPHISDKDVWIGYVTSDEIFKVATKAQSDIQKIVDQRK